MRSLTVRTIIAAFDGLRQYWTAVCGIAVRLFASLPIKWTAKFAGHIINSVIAHILAITIIGIMHYR